MGHVRTSLVVSQSSLSDKDLSRARGKAGCVHDNIPLLFDPAAHHEDDGVQTDIYLESVVCV